MRKQYDLFIIEDGTTPRVETIVGPLGATDYEVGLEAFRRRREVWADFDKRQKQGSVLIAAYETEEYGATGTTLDYSGSSPNEVLGSIAHSTPITVNLGNL